LRFIYTVALILLISSCSLPGSVTTVDAPKEGCENVDRALEPVKGLRTSEFLKTVEQLACLYGQSVARASANCPLEVHAPEYFGKDDAVTYGLKEPARVALLKSYGRGHEIGMDFEIALIKSGWEPDGTACQNEINRFPDEFDSLVRASKSLARTGY
jgi:hypothetical protein